MGSLVASNIYNSVPLELPLRFDALMIGSKLFRIAEVCWAAYSRVDCFMASRASSNRALDGSELEALRY